MPALFYINQKTTHQSGCMIKKIKKVDVWKIANLLRKVVYTVRKVVYTEKIVNLLNIVC